MKCSGVIVALAATAHGLVLPAAVFDQRPMAPAESLWLGRLVEFLVPAQQLYRVPPSEFEEWAAWQENTLFHGVIANIGGLGFKDPAEVLYGAVIASTSKQRPNYFYQWTRDAALTINLLVDELDDEEFDPARDTFGLKPVVEGYIEEQYHLQRLTNPSGDFALLTGLGEPKFMPTGEAFTDNWGRPQRDGPGLRAITIMHYLRLVAKYGRTIDNLFLQLEEFVYRNIVKPDLEYVERFWQESGFDLWEEINSIHLFNLLTQVKAVADGIELADKLGDGEFAARLRGVYARLKYFVEHGAGFRPFTLTHLIETPSLVAEHKRGGLDAAILLALLHAHHLDPTDSQLGLAGGLEVPFDTNNPYLVNTLYEMVKDMGKRYPINHLRLNDGSGSSLGMALGRYPEDIYDGVGFAEGNPWFISTALAAEVLYRNVYRLYKFQQDLTILAVSREFYQMFMPRPLDADGSDTVIAYGLPLFREVTSNLLAYADLFLDVVREHVDDEGHMSEQFNRYSGYMRGAENLTWSYAAVWLALRWRRLALQF